MSQYISKTYRRLPASVTFANEFSTDDDAMMLIRDLVGILKVGGPPLMKFSKNVL